MAFPSRLQQLLNQGRAKIGSAMKCEFGTGTYGFFSGKGSLTYNGLIYRGNTLIQVEEPAYGLGTTANPIVVKLPARGDLHPDKLREIENEDYKGRPVTFYDFYFDPDNNQFLHAEPTFFGYVDTIDHLKEAGEKLLRANIESEAIDNFREGYRYAGHEDQQLVSKGDMFFEHASRTRNEFFNIEFNQK